MLGTSAITGMTPAFIMPMPSGDNNCRRDKRGDCDKKLAQCLARVKRTHKSGWQGITQTEINKFNSMPNYTFDVPGASNFNSKPYIYGKFFQ